MAPVTKGFFRVVSRTDTTVVSQIDGKEERLSRDRVVVASAVDELMRKKVLQNEEDETQHKRAEEKGTAKTIDIARGMEKYVID